ncbi:MAG TPA: HIT domain-containing protein [Candidatus Paceibacterota bacterium]|nr:HIT domain-containing protein [Candidatus Paceibacterota bacterium]
MTTNQANCLFCKIVTGTIPTAKIYEDDHTIAFLDIRPNSKGHSLVIPKKHSQDFLHTDKETASSLIQTVHIVAQKLESVLGTSHMNIATNVGQEAGQIIFHTHIHIIPRYKGVVGKGYSYKEKEMEELAENIRTMPQDQE